MKSEAADYEALVGDVHDLRAFALAVDLRSFTATAKLMGESKATVSRRIARLDPPVHPRSRPVSRSPLISRA